MEHIVKNDEQFAPNCKCGAGRMFQGLFNYVFSSSPLEKEPDILGRESKGDLFYVIRFSAHRPRSVLNMIYRISYLNLEGFGNATMLSSYGKNLSSQRHYNKKPTLLTLFINHEIQSRVSGGL